MATVRANAKGPRTLCALHLDRQPQAALGAASVSRPVPPTHTADTGLVGLSSVGRRQKMGQPRSSGAVQGTHTGFWGVWALKRKRHHCVNRWKLRSDFRVLSSVTWSPLAGKCARCCPRRLRSPARPPTQTRPFPEELAWWAVFLSPANVLCAGRRGCAQSLPRCLAPTWTADGDRPPRTSLGHCDLGTDRVSLCHQC